MALYDKGWQTAFAMVRRLHERRLEIARQISAMFNCRAPEENGYPWPVAIGLPKPAKSADHSVALRKETVTGSLCFC